MANIFQKVKRRMSGVSLIVFLVSVGAITVGLAGFTEDTTSSKVGIDRIIMYYNLELITYDFVAWMMALAPQIGQILFSYVYLADTKQKWAIWLAGSFFGIDFISDLYYRTAGDIGFDERTLVAALFTLLFFTVISEMFITFGFGVMVETSDDAASQFDRLIKAIGVWLGGDRKKDIGTGKKDAPISPPAGISNQDRNDQRRSKRKGGNGREPLSMTPSVHNRPLPPELNLRTMREENGNPGPRR